MTVTLTRLEKIFGWIFLAATAMVLPMAVVSVCGLLRLQLDAAQLNCTVFILNFLLTVLIFWKFLWKNSMLTITAPGRTFAWMGIGFAIYYGASTLVSTLIITVAPDFANANDESIRIMAREHFWLMSLGTVILAPVTEEVLYRGLVFGSLRRRCRWLAYVVSILVFSALHVVSYIGVLSPLHIVLSVLQYLPGAFALAFAYDKSGSIWSSILIHMSINLFAMISMVTMR